MSENRKMDSSVFHEIVAEIRRFSAGGHNLDALQEFTVNLIAMSLPHYNWVGFYMLDPNDSSVLVLGPFRGAATEHVRIPVTEGICGAAVAQGSSIIIDDVTIDPRYLACSLETRSEIVVPIRANGEIIGEIDIDSHDPAAFGPEDQNFLEECAGIIGAFMAAHTQRSTQSTTSK